MSTGPSGLRVTLYSKPDCHLCETLKADLLAMQAALGFTLIERNIEEDPDDFLRFRYLIPVLDIETGVVAANRLLYPPHTWHTVHSALVGARSAMASDRPGNASAFAAA